jgi:alpha-beta hydrolase superfamily lysophospholipase
MNQILNHPIITERYFFPRTGTPRHLREFQGAEKTRLGCAYRSPHDKAKTLVHFHGNGEIVADYDDGYVDSLLSLGVNVLMVEYRGYGSSGGAPELGKMLEDVRSVREQCGLEPGETIVYGRSVGAIFAVEWAFQEPGIAGLVLESGVADPYQRLAIRLEPSELGCSEQELRTACDQHLDHRAKLANFSAPLLVMHAKGDTLVEPDHARAHMSYAQGSNNKLVLFDRGDHNTILGANWKEYLNTLKAFIDSV